MKLLTITGTRPELIRLSVIIPKLDAVCNQIIVHTGQNYDKNLNDIFFSQLGLRKQDYSLNAKGSLSEQMSYIWTGMERVIEEEKPDKVLVLGDTNSSLGAIIAKRMGIPVYHMEAGNRCYDDRVPEEVNRRLIDHSSDILLPYTESSRRNLLREGIEANRIYVSGNPIYEVIKHYENGVNSIPPIKNPYILATLHRTETVEVEDRLRKALKGLELVSKEFNLPIILSLHPHTRKKIIDFGIEIDKCIGLLEPMGFFEFISLEKNAFCVLSDSGTVCEETSIFGVPCVTMRDSTERPETLDCGSNILSGIETENILQCAKIAINNKGKWNPPEEYLRENVSDTIVKIVCSYRLKGV
jgi:UDP-N-acetylglucosamine 2-epimerase (non-hydrolysing)